MNVNFEKQVGQIVLDHPGAANVFEKYGIDFCCNGRKTLHQVCQEQALSHDMLKAELNDIPESSANPGDGGLLAAPNLDFRSWSLDRLADYIEQTHHRYVNENLPVINRYLEKIKTVHGNAHPELREIEAIFHESAGELTRHMKKEELILFPFIRKLVKMKNRGETIDDPSSVGAIQNPVKMMLHDHDAEAERFRRMALLSNHFTPPEDACATYQATFSKMLEFERDLHRHIHLENNLLFPKAVEMERQLHN